MNPITLVATDLDGTLFYDRENITSRDRACLARLRDAGVTLVFATGRELDGVRPALRRLSLWDAPRYIIHSGGGGIYDVAQDRDDALGVMDAATLRDIYRRYKGYGVPIMISQHGRLYTSMLTDILRNEARLLGYEITEVPDFESVLTEPNGKIVMNGTIAQLERMLPIVTADPDPRYRWHRSHDNYIDCYRAGIDKGAALGKLCAMLGVPLSDTLAIGDNLNDLQLLSTAGHSACPGDAHPDVLPAVDFVACPAQEGAVACACDHFIPPRP